MKYWFKRRRYGYGWVPVTWQGWLMLLALIASTIIAALTVLGTDQDPPTSRLALFIVLVFIFISLFVFVTSKVSPAAKWRWGKKPGDNQKEDW